MVVSIELVEAAEPISRVDATRVLFSIKRASVGTTLLALVQEVARLAHGLVHDVTSHERLLLLGCAALSKLAISSVLRRGTDIDVVRDILRPHCCVVLFLVLLALCKP